MAACAHAVREMPAEARERAETGVADDPDGDKRGASRTLDDPRAWHAEREEISAAIDRLGARGLQAQLAAGAIAARCLGQPSPAAALPLRLNQAEARILTRLAGAGFDREWLLRCVSMYAMAERYPFVSTPPALTACHLLDALRLPESERESMLRRAHGEKLTTRAFRAAVAAMRRERGETRGRPRRAPARRALAYVEKARACVEKSAELLREPGARRER